MYAEESVSFSNLMQMRMVQLRNFGVFYLGLSGTMFVVTFILLIVYSKDDMIFKCFNECSVPNTTDGSVVMFVKTTYEQLQVYGLLYFFWWLPRKFVQAQARVMD